jgi:hypothetical protein
MPDGLGTKRAECRMNELSAKYWKEWRLGVVIWLVGVGGAFAYISGFPDKTDVNDFLMYTSAVVGICAMIDPLLHPWLIKRGLRRA